MTLEENITAEYKALGLPEPGSRLATLVSVTKRRGATGYAWRARDNRRGVTYASTTWLGAMGIAAALVKEYLNERLDNGRVD